MFSEAFSGSKHHMNECGYVKLFQSWLLSCSHDCQTTILHLRFWAPYTMPHQGSEPLHWQGTSPSPALCYLLAVLLQLLFHKMLASIQRKQQQWCYVGANVCGKARPAAGKQSSWTQGEAGHAPGPVPNICHDTQMIFAGSWQVLTSLWLVQYLSVW